MDIIFWSEDLKRTDNSEAPICRCEDIQETECENVTETKWRNDELSICVKY